jgi:phosphotransferase system  glucose/maltose/N-acetylglucosamine-specific IIC component
MLFLTLIFLTSALASAVLRFFTWRRLLALATLSFLHSSAQLMSVRLKLTYTSGLTFVLVPIISTIAFAAALYFLLRYCWRRVKPKSEEDERRERKERRAEAKRGYITEEELDSAEWSITPAAQE